MDSNLNTFEQRQSRCLLDLYSAYLRITAGIYAYKSFIAESRD